MTSTTARRVATGLAAAIFWLLAWQLAALWVGRSYLLVGPWTVVRRLAELVPTASFWGVVGRSFGRIALGFCSALVVGVGLAAAAGALRWADQLVTPLIKVIRSVPVFSFVILVLLWTSSQALASVVSFLMVMPIMYLNVREGIEKRDAELLEMARVFQVPTGRRLVAIDIPGVWPYLMAACRVGLGLAWKSGISGEVIGLPTGSIGERLYQAKLFLSSADLFAWTLAVICLSFIGERAAMAGLDAIRKRLDGAWSA